MRTFAAALLLLSLCACSKMSRAGWAYLGSDYATACTLAKEAANEGTPSAYGPVGECYEKGLGGHPRDQERALYYYTMGARHGDKEARGRLVALGQEVPSADLAPTRSASRGSDLDPLIASQIISNAWAPKPYVSPYSPSVTCRTNTIGNFSRTTCD